MEREIQSQSAEVRSRLKGGVCPLLVGLYRWIKLPENGKFKSVRELANKEKTDKAKISKFMRLTCLAPDIQKVILYNTGTWVLSLKDSLKPFPMLWTEQRDHFREITLVAPVPDNN